MAKRVFKADLSAKGIEDLKRRLIQYRDVELPNKCKELTAKLAELGIQTAQVHVDQSPLGKYITFSTNIEPSKLGYKAVLMAVGAVKESEDYESFSTILAIEFGAGIYHNQVSNPKADKLGFGVGTFPGQMHAFEDGWYYWDEKAQEWRYTHGVKATMPMNNASVEIIQNVVRIAREIFSR